MYYEYVYVEANMLQKIKAAIEIHSLIPEGGKVLIGLSGGADSIFLTEMLSEISNDSFSICAAHFNHGIRGVEADEDEAFVLNYCANKNIPLLIERANILSYAEKNMLSIETAARLLRYDFLERSRKSLECDVIATAHHADDNVESILLHLFRGSGSKGLIGMEYKRERIIRPLLNVWRSEIEKFLFERNINYRTDRTNLIAEGSRNILRLEILPLIQKNINPSVKEVILRCSSLIREDELYFKELTESAFMDCIEGYKNFDIDQDNEIKLSIEKLKELSHPILTRLIKYALSKVGVVVDIERVHVNSIIELMYSQSGASLDLPRSKARVSFDKLILSRIEQGERRTSTNGAENKTLYLKITEENMENFALNKGKIETDIGVFHISFVKFDDIEFNRDISYLDYDKITFPIEIRTRRNGDRFLPINAPGECKLKDYFIARKVDRNERDFIPLIVSQNKIAAIAGFTISEDFKVDKSSKRILEIKFKKFNNQY